MQYNERGSATHVRRGIVLPRGVKMVKIGRLLFLACGLKCVFLCIVKVALRGDCEFLGKADVGGGGYILFFFLSSSGHVGFVFFV